LYIGNIRRQARRYFFGTHPMTFRSVACSSLRLYWLSNYIKPQDMALIHWKLKASVIICFLLAQHSCCCLTSLDWQHAYWQKNVYAFILSVYMVWSCGRTKIDELMIKQQLTQYFVLRKGENGMKENED